MLIVNFPYFGHLMRRSASLCGKKPACNTRYKSAYNAGDSGSIPGSGSSPGKGEVTHPCILGLTLVAQMVRNCLQCGRPGFDLWVGKTPWRKAWQPTPVFLSGESHGQRSLGGFIPWGHKESDMTERLSTIF